MIFTVAFDKALGVELDSERCIIEVVDGSPAADAGMVLGDSLITLNEEDAAFLSAELTQQQLSRSGRATFRREDPDERLVLLVCSRCATRNSVKETTNSFRCFSCLATSVSWKYVMTSSPAAAPSAPP